MRKRSLFILLMLSALFVILVPISSAAQRDHHTGLLFYTKQTNQADENNIFLLDQLGGEATAIATQGNFVYAGIGPRLVVFEFDNQGSLIPIGQSDILPGLIADIWIVDDLAYLANYDGGLRIVDISVPNIPQEIGYYQLPDVVSVVVDENYAYVANYSFLYVISVITPSAPTRVARLQVPDVALANIQIVKGGDYIYLLVDSRLISVAISDPENPEIVNTFTLQAAGTSIAIAGNYLYMGIDGSGTLGYFQILDISSPLAPIVVGSLQTQEIEAISIVGGKAYVYAKSRLYAIDVSDPQNPSEIGNYYYFNFTDGAVNGNYAFGTSGRIPGIRMIDISYPANMSEIGAYEYEISPDIRDWAASEAHLFLQDNLTKKLEVIDITNPVSMTWVSDFQHQNEEVRGVKIDGDYAYVFNERYNICCALYVDDISDPKNIVELGYTELSGQNSLDIAISDGYAYVLISSPAQLLTVDVISPTNPTEITSYELPDFSGVVNLELQENLLYITDWNGLRILDVSTPATPQEISYTEFSFSVMDSVIQNDFIYFSAVGGFRVFNISNPYGPSEIGVYKTSKHFTSLDIDANYAYITQQGLFGFEVLDISNPTMPTEAASYYDGSSVDGDSYEILKIGKYIYILDKYRGLNSFGGQGTGTYSISGQTLESDYSTLLPGVTVSTNTGLSTISDSNGIYSFTNLITGTYTLSASHPNYEMSPETSTITVPPDQTEINFWGWPLPPKPVVVLVHGFQSPTTEGFSCSPSTGATDIVHYSDVGNVNEATKYWGDMPDWLADDYDVWVAQLDTGKPTTLDKPSTPSLDSNGECLRSQIDHVYHQTGEQKVTVIAHSMGGLVSRNCLSDGDCRNKVQTLVTLGSPHAGLPAAKYAEKILGIACAMIPGVCEMSFENMEKFNKDNPNRRGISYYFIGGDGSSGPYHWYLTLWYPESGSNDSLVGKISAVGWKRTGFFEVGFHPYFWTLSSPPRQYWTDEFHSTATSFEDGDQDKTQIRDDYYHWRYQNSNRKSNAYECFTSLLDGGSPASDICSLASPSTTQNAAYTVASSPSQSTQLLKGVINAGDVLTDTLTIDNDGQTIFYTAWHTGTLSVNLQRPDGQVIDPAYAASHPDEVAYDSGMGGGEAPPFATYSITNTLPGAWSLIVDATSLGTTSTDFWAFGLLESNRTLGTGVDGYYYQHGDTAVLTATLQSDGSGFAGATVSAEISRSDGITDTVTLIDQGGGNYTADYTIPDTPGYLSIAVVAIGNDGGTDFSRQDNLLAIITSQDALFTGTYSDQGNDDNSDGFYETLDFTAEVSVSKAGDYIVSGLLFSEDGQFITNLSVAVSLETGTHFVTLPFNGDDIRAAEIDGPYTVTNMQISKINTGIPSQILDNEYATNFYNWNNFGSSPVSQLIYLPLVIK